MMVQEKRLESIQALIANFPQLQITVEPMLSSLTYFRVGGPALAAVKLDSIEQMKAVIVFLKQHDLEFLILGDGSNVIAPDKGIAKVILLPRFNQVEFRPSTKRPNTVEVLAEAGITLSTLVKMSVKQGLSGLEPFIGVPGRLGGAIFNNSHFAGRQIGEYVSEVEILDGRLEQKWLFESECQFEYDHTRFHETHEIILSVKLQLERGDTRSSLQLMKKHLEYRQNSQPLGLPSSGCIFKNPKSTNTLSRMFPQFVNKKEISAGFLIDQTGLKGTRVGGVVVSDKHAAFMINTGNATALDLKKLIELVKTRVYQQFQVELEEEVFWLS